MKSLDETLQGWCDDGKVTRKDIAAAADCGVSSVGEWMSGKAKPELDTCREMIGERSKLPREMKDYIAAWMLRGTQYTPCEIDKPTLKDLDRNGDGRVDSNDVERFNIEAIENAVDAAKEITTGGVTEDVKAALREGHKNLALAMHAADYNNQQRGPRLRE